MTEMAEREKMWTQLEERIRKNYEEMKESWETEFSVSDLIGNAEWIAAAKIMAENYLYCVSEDTARQLLTLQNPLEALADLWVEQTDNNLFEMQDLIEREIDRDWLTEYEKYEPEDDTPDMKLG